jgi:hypothetical protein
MADDIRWIRSYVLEEGGGSVGTVCIYQATSRAVRSFVELCGGGGWGVAKWLLCPGPAVIGSS